MSCNFTEKISSLIDGELSPVEARQVESHLVTCAHCAEARADFLSLRSQIANFESTLAPAVQNRALAKILSRSDREKTVGHRRGWNWGYGVAALASFAIIALIVGLIIGFIPSKKTQELAVNGPRPASSVAPPVSSPTPAPTVEPPKSDNTEKRTETPRRQQPVRKPPVREPKPGEQFAVAPQPVRPADAQTMTALHFERAETLLRAFRNVRLDAPGSATEVSYERDRARQLVFKNMMLRREADAAGDIQVSSLLENLEPILLDIANLPDNPDADAVRVIRERVERKNIVGLLQVNSNALARALD